MAPLAHVITSHAMPPAQKREIQCLHVAKPLLKNSCALITNYIPTPDPLIKNSILYPEMKLHARSQPILNPSNAEATFD